MNAADVIESVVTRLVDAIEAGAPTWQMPWRTLAATGWPTNAATGNRYSGGNVIALYLAAADRQHPTARWATYKQWHTLGAQVRRGEHGTLGIVWKATPHQLRRGSSASRQPPPTSCDH
jgi:antirestriction protein ArdC